jgi:hypothetical protein
MSLKTNNLTKSGVIVLSIILLTGISLVSTLEIKVQGQVQNSPAPPTPGTTAPPASSAAPPSPGGSPSSGTTSPPLTTPPDLDTADGGQAANQTGEGGGAGNQSAVVMIPLTTMQMIMSQLQDAVTAIDSNNKDNATKAMNSVDQELKSAANASGITIETSTG